MPNAVGDVSEVKAGGRVSSFSRKRNPDFFHKGGFVTASNGTISVVKNAPHPNAAKLYLNYLLSNEGQVAWSKASGLASLRRDVPRDHIPEILLPQEGVSYQETYREKYVLMRREIVDFINSVLQR